MPELQAYVKQFSTPIVIFEPSNTSSDPNNSNRVRSLVQNINTRGQMAIVPLVQPDRGILIFTTGTPPKLMGAICLVSRSPAVPTLLTARMRLCRLRSECSSNNSHNSKYRIHSSSAKRMAA